MACPASGWRVGSGFHSGRELKLLFHADDAGATASITERILHAWRSGWLDSFSIMTNGEACGLISEALKVDPFQTVRLAVHLNLSEGPPASPVAEVSMLVNHAGILKHTFVSLLVVWTKSPASKRQVLVRQIETEWRAQVRRAKDICAPRAVHAVDSHNHVHMLPFLFPIALKVAEEEHIGKIRISREPFFVSSRLGVLLRVQFLTNVVKHFLLRHLAGKADRLRARTSVASGGALIGVFYTGMMSETAARAGIRAAKRSGQDSAEVVFHIGRARENESARWSHMPRVSAFFLSPQRDEEFEALRKLRDASVQ